MRWLDKGYARSSKRNLMPDHVHMCCAIPPKSAVAHHDRLLKEERIAIAGEWQRAKLLRRALLGAVCSIHRQVQTEQSAHTSASRMRRMDSRTI